MNAVSTQYAAALYDLTADEEAFAATVEELTGQSVLWDALVSPAIRAAEKKAVLRRLPCLKGQETLLHFYELLCDKGRMALLPEIRTAYARRALEVRGAAVCVMTCVHVPDQAQQEKLRALLCKLHGKKDIRLDIRLDPALLGGFLLQVEGVTYDQSVRGRLEQLELKLRERRVV